MRESSLYCRCRGLYLKGWCIARLLWWLVIIDILGTISIFCSGLCLSSTVYCIWPFMSLLWAKTFSTIWLTHLSFTSIIFIPFWLFLSFCLPLWCLQLVLSPWDSQVKLTRFLSSFSSLLVSVSKDRYFSYLLWASQDRLMTCWLTDYKRKPNS